ncbi:Signal recognition particle 9 kDa protein [Glycine soja]|uniref:Signal recognition particle 9 kDa protein n=1 Tax=Glycine soja TaxID=3848 RepID=A0A445LPS1_GLYSO|nr:Signal recognition particle 9 kDa protein [Glycine soja]
MMETMKVWMGMLQSAEDVGDPPNMENLDDEDQAQEAKKMEKLNNIFFTLMARGPEVDPSEVTGKEPMDTQTTKRGRGRKQ